jgi:arylsulfatase A-like enzyme
VKGSFIPGAFATLVALLGGLVAWRSGGAGETASMPPAPLASASADAASAPSKGAGQDAEEVSLRLLEALKDAKLELPALQRGLYALDGHWRKMQAPWTGLSGTAAKAALSYALLTSEKEEEYTVPLASGGVWRPDARQWNMAEGAFDERDAILAPTPAKIAYRLSVPLHASLDFSVTTDNAPADVKFSVRVVDAKGATSEVWTRVLSRKETKKWFDAKVDLSAYGGQSVELSLVTELAGEGYGATAVALWGNPVVLVKEPTRAPYNVLWIVVDATRADAVASFHDDKEDAAKLSAPLPPLEAFLPKVPGLTPNLDDLGKHGVRFTHAYSAASWTRPGTVAMLSGARSTQLGLDSLHWQLPDSEVTRFYASDPPLLPLLLRGQGVVTRAFVNNYFMVGYAAVGVDLGFEAISDYRFRTLDTREITTHAVDWLKENKDERFFLFCNYNSPHEPLDPPARFLSKVPPPPAGPTDPQSAKYMAEVAKDDEAIGVLMKTLVDLGLRDHTIVVMTADHGETLSSAHSGVSALDHMKVRYHHSASNFEETTHVPILLSLPGKLPEDLTVSAVARTIDIAPTLLELEGLEPAPKMTGRSLMPLITGKPDGDPRIVLSEGRGTRGFMVGRYRLLTREGKAETIIYGDKEVQAPEELFDLETDPGERRNLKKSSPDKLAEMRARLDAALHEVPASGAAAPPPSKSEAGAVTLRFAGGGAAHRISGAVWVDRGATLNAKPVGIGADALRATGSRVDLAFSTLPDASVGLDVEATPSGAPLHWDLYVDDRKLTPAEVFAGPFGLGAPALALGITTDEGRSLAFSPKLSFLDPRRDFGLFVTRERGVEPEAVERGNAGKAGTEEMNRLMREWGYAHDKASSDKR